MTDAFARSGSPHFNEVLRAAQEVWEGGGAEALVEPVQAMRGFLEDFRGCFERGMQVREPTPLKAEVDGRVHRALADLERALEQIEGFREDGDRERLVQGARTGREAVERMFADFRRLQEEEARFPVYSPAPYVHELLRVARGVAQGWFPVEALAEKHGWLTERCQQAVRDHEEWARLVRGREAELNDRVRSRLQEMAAALEEMGRFFEDGQVEHLEAGSQALGPAAEALVELWNRLCEAGGPSPLTCPRCGAENSAGIRRCGSCSAMLPEVAPPAAGWPGSTLDLVEGASPARPVPAHLAVLEQVVQEVLAGGAGPEQLRATLHWFGENVRRGRAEFERSRLPPGAPEGLRAVRRLMEQATRGAVEGVERMEAYFTEGGVDALREGLEQVRQAAERLVEAHERTQALQARPGYGQAATGP